MIFRSTIYSLLLFTINAQTFPEIGSDETLDIITWNIENFPKNNQTENYVIQIINDINVDIIALQEIQDQNAFDNLVDNLSGNFPNSVDPSPTLLNICVTAACKTLPVAKLSFTLFRV